MVHALQEAYRVLEPGGFLMDLRPAPAHRQLGTGQGRRWKLVGSLHELLDEDHAADAAVEHVVRAGLFLHWKQTQFQIDRVLDNVQEARDFLAEFDERREQPSHLSLLERLERRYARLEKPSKIAIRGPMHLAILRKLPAAPKRGKIGAMMILALLSDASRAETLLNNLSEADFDLNDISVIMKDVTTRNKIAKDVGPLHNAQPSGLAAALKQAGASQNIAQRCFEAVNQGRVLVAMKVDPKYGPAAREMFEDASAEIVQE